MPCIENLSAALYIDISFTFRNKYKFVFGSLGLSRLSFIFAKQSTYQMLTTCFNRMSVVHSRCEFGLVAFAAYTAFK